MRWGEEVCKSENQYLPLKSVLLITSHLKQVYIIHVRIPRPHLWECMYHHNHPLLPAPSLLSCWRSTAQTELRGEYRKSESEELFWLLCKEWRDDRGNKITPHYHLSSYPHMARSFELTMSTACWTCINPPLKQSHENHMRITWISHVQLSLTCWMRQGTL